MKKVSVSLLALLLVLALSPLALAEQNIVYQVTDGRAGYSVESYPEAWITAYKVKNILEGKKRNPPAFLHIVPPQGSVPRLFDFDRATFWLPQANLSYTYLVQEPAIFNRFLKDVNEKQVVDAGKDKQKAIYLGAESHRIYALLVLPEDYYGQHGGLKLHIADLSNARSDEELIQIMNEEILRLQSAMTYEKLEKYWSQDVVENAQIVLPEAGVMMDIRTDGIVVLGANGNNLSCMYMTEAGKARSLAFHLETYSFPHRMEKSKDLTVAGIAGKVSHNDGIFSVALPIGETEELGGMPLYLVLEIEGKEEDVPAVAEDAYARVTLGTMP